MTPMTTKIAALLLTLSVVACETPSQTSGHYTVQERAAIQTPPTSDAPQLIRPELPAIAQWEEREGRLTVFLSKMPIDGKVCLDWVPTGPYPYQTDWGRECFEPSDLKAFGNGVRAERERIAAAVAGKK